MHCASVYRDQMSALRRRVHRRPEEGWTEFETTALIVSHLRSLQFEVRCGRAVIHPDFVMGRDPHLVAEAVARAKRQGVSEELLSELDDFTGAVGIWDSGRPGPVTAFRFDIDCVQVGETPDPAHEANAGGYASERPNLMHACGHDGHLAVGLGVAQWIKDHADQLCGKIKLVFQPAEEGTRGARPMAESGILDDVDFIVCTHIGSSVPLHQVAVCTHGYLATTKLDIYFEGVPAHAGANPEKGRSALMAACSAAMMLVGIPRSGEGNTRIAVGRLTAGEGRNVVPVHAHLQIETRGSTADVNRYMVDCVKRITAGTALAYDVKSRIEKVGEASELITDQAVTDDLMSIAHAAPSIEAVELWDDIRGSDDCTILINRVRAHGGKSGYFLFGCNQNGHHRSDFAIQDEESLPAAFELFTGFLELKNGLRATCVLIFLSAGIHPIE